MFVLLPLALVSSGLAAGGLMISALGGAPLLMTLPVAQYIPVHQFLVTRFDPFMPITLCTALICDVAMAVLTAGTLSGVLAAAAAAFLAAAMAVSLTRNVPINRWVGRLDPDRIPANFAEVDPRVRWRNWNRVRTTLAVAALASNGLLAAVAL